MKRIILAIAVVVVLASLAVGITLSFRRHKGPKLLIRADMAQRAAQFDKAISLADRYITEYPGDWRGHFSKAKAYVRLGRYADARGPLRQALQLDGQHVSISIALAETYSLPSATILDGFDASTQAKALNKTIADLGRANVILAGAKADHDPDALLLKHAAGLNKMQIARAHSLIAQRLKKETETAIAAGAGDICDIKQAQSQAAHDMAERASRDAAETLLDVVRKAKRLLAGTLDDSSRKKAAAGMASAAEAAARLSITLGDSEYLRVLRLEISGMEQVVPVAATMLAVHDIESSSDDNPAERMERFRQVCRSLDDILAGLSDDNHPQRSKLKLTRAELALRLSDFATARRLCDEILDANPRNAQGRLLKARLLMKENKPAEAERNLFVLKTELPHWIDAQFAYAHAAHATGKGDLARQAMNAVIRLDPDNAPAHKYLAQSFLAGSLYDQAFDHARAYFRTLPGDHAAMRLFVQAAKQAGRANLARSILAQAIEDNPSSAKMLMAVAEGYIFLGDHHKAAALAERAAGDKPAAIGRSSDAEETLSKLTTIAAEDKDIALARRVAVLYLRMGQLEKALAVCDEFRSASPNDPKCHLLTAAILTAAGKPGRAVDYYEKAIALGPRIFSTYQVLARTLDGLGRPTEAMEVLDRLDGVGRAGHAVALLERANTLARWGLQDPAARCLEELAELDVGRADIQLALGRALAGLDERNKAKSVLQSIPSSAPQYAAAQVMLSGLAESTEDKLEILRGLEEAQLFRPSILVRKMNVLVEAGRRQEAVEAFYGFADTQNASRPLPHGAAALAVKTMLELGDSRRSVELAVRMAKRTSQPRWRRLAALLNIDAEAASAAMWLAEPAAADLRDALLGLCVALGTQDDSAAKDWLGRIKQIEHQSTQSGKGETLSLTYRLLVALASGQADRAAEQLEAAEGLVSLELALAGAFISSAKNTASAPADALQLLKAYLAIDLGLPSLGRQYAMSLLKRRPTCQWAGALVIWTKADKDTLNAVLGVVAPSDCVLAEVIRASLLEMDGKDEAAAALYARAAKAAGGNGDLLAREAKALENSGRLAAALELYERIWSTTRNPAAANNAAYVLSCMAPNDPDRLARACELAAAAVEAAPRVAAFRDTKGWVAYLAGRNQQACTELRGALKYLSDSPEVHYHLALAEAAAGNDELASWHLAAAVNIGNKLRTEGKNVYPTAARAIELAQKNLEDLRTQQ